ncbi:DUF4212 domain-containing protein [Fodinibius sp. Rm-B-1B1-1]|uniref:DUF4212 domain-containing protein n=1 Tax=Fodinibius alkaliphilus TaxID=3140241 RepID=UPI003159B08C
MEQSKRSDTNNSVNYLESKVNIFAPSTPFMREHLKVIWWLFAAWVAIVFGPVTVTFFIPEIMANITFLGFPLHYFLTAIGGPLGALILSFIYARKRDQMDERYDIQHTAGPESIATKKGTE